jgi:predicted permease
MFFDDLRESARTLLKQPRFLITASLTLGLGIGTVTSIFSVVNAVLLTPLPYSHSERLVNVWSTAPGLGYPQFPVSPDLFLFFKRHNHVFDDMALIQNRRANLTDAGTPEVVDASVTTQSYFATLGVPFARGRGYTTEEDSEKGARVAVVSSRLWARRYGRDAGLVGRTIRIDGEPTTVIGIAPPRMDRAGSPDLWMPARFNPENPPSGNFGWNAIARMKPGISVFDAEQQLKPLVQRAMNEYIDSANYRAFLADGQYRPLVHSMREDLIGDVRQPLWILLGTVGMVLLVACSNVANLLLVRAEGRQREIAVRMAIGSSRSALVRKFLAEAAVLSTAGAVLGVAFTAAAVPVLLRLAPETLPLLDQVRVNATVLLFAIGIASVSAVVFGLLPAIRYSRPDVVASLRQGGRGATGHPARHRTQQALVVVQTAMALVLLVGSGLLARSFMRLMSTDQGFAASGVLTFRVALPQTTYGKAPDVVRFTQQLVDRLVELSNVESAGATTELPVVAGTSGTAFEIEGRPVAAGQLPPIIHISTVTPGYFSTLKIALLRGSDFDSSDARDGVRTILINKAAADQFWPGQDAIGKRVRGAGQDAQGQRLPWYVVKGVVTSVRHDGLRESPRPMLYFPLNEGRNDPPRAFSYVLRGPNVRAQADAVRRAVWTINAELPVTAVQSMDDVVQRSVTQFSFTMLTLGIAAAIALVLGAIGLYGVLSYAVSLRTREIGVRIALGAPPRQVQRGIVGNAATITSIGLVIGALGAAGLTRFLGTLLYETRPLDLATFAAMSLLLFGVGLLASYFPARKAASVSPMEAMRTE